MEWDKKVYEIYEAYKTKMTKFYDVESSKTQIMIKESELLYGLDSNKLQAYAKLKKEVEEYIKLQSLDLIEFMLSTKSLI